jgi:hypothetical protein
MTRWKTPSFATTVLYWRQLEAHPEPQPVVHAPLELQAHEAADGGFAA